MRHRVGYNRLSRTPSHRKALHKNMVTSLFRHERITTTKAKAREIRRTAEKMVTRAKVDSVHNRRTIGKLIKDEAVLAKLFTDIGPRFKSRPGGYTRMLKIGQRKGDASELVILELVDRTVEAKETPARRRRGPAAPADQQESQTPETAEPAETRAENKPARRAKARSTAVAAEASAVEDEPAASAVESDSDESSDNPPAEAESQPKGDK